MKKIFCGIGILLVMQAYAMNMDNWEKDGFPIIIPKVKQCVRTDERFPLPKTLSVSAPDELSLKGLEETLSDRAGGKIVRSKEGVVRFLLTEKNVPENKEGYTLEVSRNGVTIAARALAGLNRGLQSLRWIIRNTRGTELKGCKITDFPDLEIRAVFFEINYLPPEKVDALCRAIDIYAQLKYNTLLIDFGDNFPLKGNPYSLRKTTFSLADIQKIQAACKANSMEIIPFIQAVTHTLWMTRHPEFKEKISEGKPGSAWLNSYCLSKPLPEKLMKQYLAEVTEILKPRYFHIALDELNSCPFQVCPECKKKNPVELFGNHAKMLQDFLLERGVIPIIAHDQFDAEAPWWAGSKVREALKKFDRRVIVNIWDYNIYPNEKSCEYFNRLGFKVFYMSYSKRLENTRNLPLVCARTKGLGCVLTWWLSLAPTLEWRLPYDINAYASVIIGANDSWNVSDEPILKRTYDPIFEVKRLVERKKALDYENLNGVEIPLNRAVNTRLGKNPEFPLLDAAEISELKKELAAEKAHFHLIADQENYFGIVLKGDDKDPFPAGSVEIPVGRTVGGLSFLMAAAPFNDFLVPYRSKLLIGELRINYENRKSVLVQVRCGNTLNTWNAECGGYNTRIVNRGTDLRGAVYSFYALDWKNPFPSRKIKSIMFSTKKSYGVAPGLFAISAFGAGTGGEAAMSDAEIAKLVPAGKTAKTDMKLCPVADFEPGQRRDLVFRGTTYGRFIFRPRFKVIDNPPDAPSKGRMLSITVPPLAENRAWGRVVVDIPLGTHKDFKTVLFDMRCSHPEWIWRGDVYLHNLGTGKANALLSFNPIPKDNGFYTIAIPREAFRGREGGGADFSGKVFLRIGFFVENPQAMTIDLDRVSVSEELLPWIRELRIGADSKNQEVKQ
ncbi:MAG: glycoside hydrolase family 20 zincin-like fold domain-containing protein [Victivallales bacterium]|nr:glycoside hydrolase family 20 zincin-like fold domain-containing protein [Victivallales bacterium]